MTDADEATLDEAREFARAVLRAFPRLHHFQTPTTKTTKEHA